MHLTEEHINYIVRDIHFRGIVVEDLGEELVDHVSILVEKRMEQGERFIEAYDEVMKSFGNTSGIHQLQKHSIELTNNNTKLMFKNNLKIAFRNLSKQRFYTFINVAGLAVGIACCLLIVLFVNDELSYDHYHTKSDNIYRITRYTLFNEQEFHYPVNPAPLAEAMVNDIPEVEYAVRFRNYGSFLVSLKDSPESFKETKLTFSDKDFFKVFSVPVVKGNPETALEKPSSVAISASTAKKYFGEKDPTGQTMILDGDNEYNVTAIFEDMPANGHLQFDFLMSMESLEESRSDLWLSNNFYTYILVKDGTEKQIVEEKLNRMVERYIEPQIVEIIGKTIEEFAAAGNKLVFNLQALPDIYLTSNFRFDIGITSDITYVYLFSAIALFILVIACINFMNLSTARSASRAKEVGVRKALGSFRSHLVRQFLTESILLCVLAFVLAIVIATTVLPFFNDLSGKVLEIPVSSPWFYGIMLFSILIIGTTAGMYPAFFLSSFRPANVLKGRSSQGPGGSFIRSTLVVFQFFISILLMIGTVAVYRQLNFIQNKKLGFEKERVIMVNDAYMLDDQLTTFKDELRQLPQISSVSASSYIPVSGYNRSDMSYWREGEQPTENNMINMQTWTVDHEYVKTMGMKIIHGRDFDEKLATDSTGVVLNESAFKAYGFTWGEDNMIQTFAYDFNRGQIITDEYVKYRVIGVMEDFHFESMKTEIGSLGLTLGRNAGILSIKTESDDLKGTLAAVETQWDRLAPHLPFNYTFLDEEFGDMYRAESRLATVFTTFAGLAIFIGCLGLFALAAFMAEQRTKEIGIRKVLGASVGGIVMLLSKEFGKLIVIAFLIAVPLAWWTIGEWLADYSYRVELGPGIYLFAGLAAFTIAWLTVGYQSVRAAKSDPVKSLRNE